MVADRFFPKGYRLPPTRKHFFGSATLAIIAAAIVLLAWGLIALLRWLF